MTYYIICTILLLILKRLLNKLAPCKVKKDEKPIGPERNISKVTSIVDFESKRKQVMDNIEDYSPFTDFAKYWSDVQDIPYSTILSVTQDIRSKFNVLLDLKNTQDFYYQSNELLILNVDVLIFAIKKNAPIYIDKNKKLIS